MVSRANEKLLDHGVCIESADADGEPGYEMTAY
jgi:hypothetical protein